MTKKLMTALLTLLALTACQDEPKSGEGAVETITVNGVSFKMVAIEGGTFTMGTTAENASSTPWEQPDQEVTLSSYRIGQTEVTQGLWLAVMGKNPSYFSATEIPLVERDREFGDDLNRPVEWVSWDDCQAFIEKLNELTGRHFRMPTEAEWEFAARGGNKTHGYPYAGSENVDEVAWSRGISDSMTHPVAQKKPNELGLYDMSGNVREWCLDYIEFRINWTTYACNIVRGGSYFSEYFVWTRDVANSEPGSRYSDLGLRLAE